MALTSSHQAGIDIKVRKPSFDFTSVPEIWLSTAQTSHFMNALSVFIPATERLVIDILRRRIPRVHNPQLRVEVLQLIKQEGTHARLHRLANQQLAEAGFSAIEGLTHWQVKAFEFLIKFMPTSFVTSIPAAMEHFTVNISRAVLIEQKYWQGNTEENEAVRFLIWHAGEELEHQAVCFDVYREFGHKPLWFSLSLILFWMPLSALSTYLVQGYFLAKSRRLKTLTDWRRWAGFIGDSLPLFFSGAWKYCRKGYTPWTKDQLRLLQNTNSDKVP